MLDVVRGRGAGGFESILCGKDYTWVQDDYGCGDIIVFPSHTVHKGLPNQLGDRIRTSCDIRYQPAEDEIDEQSLKPHMDLATWEELYKGWENDALKYYWKKTELRLSPSTVKKNTLTSRERVLRTFNHEEPDRVPIQYIANPGIQLRLKRHFGVEDDESLLRRLGTDFRGIWPAYTGPTLHAEISDRQVDPLWGMCKQWVANESGGYWDFCDYPLLDTPEEVYENWPMPSPDHFDCSVVGEIVRLHPDRALHLGDPGTGDILNTSGMLMGVEQAMMEIIDPDSPLQRFTDRRLAVQLGVLERALESARGRIDFLWLGEDLGTQRGPLISLDTYRQFIKPRHKKFVDLAKAWNIPVMIHCCGSSSWAFDEFLDVKGG